MLTYLMNDGKKCTANYQRKIDFKFKDVMMSSLPKPNPPAGKEIQ